MLHSEYSPPVPTKPHLIGKSFVEKNIHNDYFYVVLYGINSNLHRYLHHNHRWYETAGQYGYWKTKEDAQDALNIATTIQ